MHVTDARLQRSEGKWDLRSWKQQMLTHTSSPLTLKVRSELCGADSFLFQWLCVYHEKWAKPEHVYMLKQEISSQELCSHSVVSDSLQPHGLQHVRLPCPWPSPRVCSKSCSLSWSYLLTISFSPSSPSPVLHLSQHQGLFLARSSFIRLLLHSICQSPMQSTTTYWYLLYQFLTAVKSSE